ncbi:MAG: hypothetical protein COX57_07735 [Alphaproteobacteria bacterium CG_4_10_14_0_2_um_filter_63_37]|nr:MAG: hypothetical protein AUJ55_04485 [Proteobacteria bacterium CG1_02_64_396]PJA24642.1 MAG: hypothetical protein COX57_07735 [Alphaproteobacteria bacterium CG_4_10_14_0_2_um_filter_63_37]
MTPTNAPMSLGLRLFLSLFTMAMGAIPILSAFDLGPVGAAQINGPAWMGLAAGSVFVAAGLAVLAHGTRWANLFVFPILLGLAAMATWIGFGPGARACDGGLSVLGFVLESGSSGWICRVPFGYGAIVIDAVLLFFMLTGLQKLTGDPERWSWLGKAGEGAIWIAVAPLILVVLVPLIVLGLWEALTLRMKTGQWPRNEGFIRKQRAQGLLQRLKR